MRSRGGIRSSFSMTKAVFAVLMGLPLDTGVTGQYLYVRYRSVPQVEQNVTPLSQNRKTHSQRHEPPLRPYTRTHLLAATDGRARSHARTGRRTLARHGYGDRAIPNHRPPAMALPRHRGSGLAAPRSRGRTAGFGIDWPGERVCARQRQQPRPRGRARQLTRGRALAIPALIRSAVRPRRARAAWPRARAG